MLLLISSNRYFCNFVHFSAPNFSSKVTKFSPFEFAKFQMDRGAETPDELLSTPVFQQLMNVGTPG